MSRILAPIRYSAWLSGELGKQVHAALKRGLMDLPEMELTRLAPGFLVASKECDGVAVERVRDAVRDLEGFVAEKYPVFYHEMGQVWTVTLQAIFTEG